MAKKMLIDATQPEETRVAVMEGARLDELDFEIASRKQLRGNIYLAKVTRVEPSLQAAFVDYGGNRHGFLAFAEIHPDYYKIPVADREKLLELERELEREEEEREEAEEAAALAQGVTPEERTELFSSVSTSAGLILPLGDGGSTPTDEPVLVPELEESIEAAPLALFPPAFREGDMASPVDGPLGEGVAMGTDGSPVDQPPAPLPRAEESEEDADRRRFARRRAALLRQYKIQEVIKRNQILLIQVVKEERGNKGAALTTYLSLAGRYCVLMPNTNRGGGVSRKINSVDERRRMKSLLSQLDLPEGMSIILRTAGLERTKADIKRDLDYVMRLWDSIRDKTLSSTAPCLIHEEANLIRRAVRDLYSRDVTEIQVEGDGGYHMAKEFMRMIMPSAARRVHHYRDPAVPLFVRHRIESQIESLYTTSVTLRSGGYIVINQTEALVAIDVNSGRSTRERNIEETALRTNLEAAEEIARQLRLRDLAGLIVIDFIDMEDSRHDAQVERRLRDAMKGDRARIQLGRISMFGLLELSRQRLRPSLIETNFSLCPTCAGMGHTRSVESAALHVLRSIEEEGLQQKASEIAVNVAEDVALYLLNHKRAAIGDIERRYGIKIFVHSDSDLRSSEHKLERLKARLPGEFQFPEPPPPVVEDEPDLPLEEEEQEAIDPADTLSGSSEDGDMRTQRESETDRRRGRGRGGRGGRDRDRGGDRGGERNGGRHRGGERTSRPKDYPDVSQPGAPQPDMSAVPSLLPSSSLTPVIVSPSSAEGADDLQPANLPLPPSENSYVPLTAHGANGAPGGGYGSGSGNGDTEETAEMRRRRRGRRGGRGRNRPDRPEREDRGDRANIEPGNNRLEEAASGNSSGVPSPVDGREGGGRPPRRDRFDRADRTERQERSPRSERAPRTDGGNWQDRRPPREPREPRDHREPRFHATPPAGLASPSGGGIRIVTEIRARQQDIPPASSSPASLSPPPVSSSPVAAATGVPPASPAGGDAKPKSGWWKRLIGST